MSDTERTPRGYRLDLLRRGGVSLVKRGLVLSWLGGEDKSDMGRRNLEGDFVSGELLIEDISELGSAAVQWIGMGTDGDCVVSVIDTARGWAVLRTQLRYVETRLWVPKDPTTVTPERAVALLPERIWPDRCSGFWTLEGGRPDNTHRLLTGAVSPGADGRDGRINWSSWTPEIPAGWTFVTREQAVERLLEALRAPPKEDE